MNQELVKDVKDIKKSLDDQKKREVDRAHAQRVADIYDFIDSESKDNFPLADRELVLDKVEIYQAKHGKLPDNKTLSGFLESVHKAFVDKGVPVPAGNVDESDSSEPKLADGKPAMNKPELPEFSDKDGISDKFAEYIMQVANAREG